MSTAGIFRNCLLLCLLGSLAFIVQPAQAQADSAHVRITQVDATHFPQVTVYVSVTDGTGEPVGMDANLIQLSENGKLVKPGKVTGVGAGAFETLTTMLVMDVSGSMNNGGKLSAAKQAAGAYIDQMRAGDQAGLISFNTKIKVVQTVTADRQSLHAAIDSLTAQNDTAMYDALLKAVQELQRLAGRKAILVLTDGLDNSSTGTSQSVIDSVGPGGLSIATIGLGNPSAGGPFFGLDETALRDLAEKAGGAYAFAEDSAALQAVYQKYGRLLQSEYAITYISPSKLRDGISRVLTASLGKPGSSSATAAKYNPGGVLPEVAGSFPFLFTGILLGLIFLIFLPSLLGRLLHHKPAAKISRIKLK
jgi:Ca-activated chloride channel family protein